MQREQATTKRNKMNKSGQFTILGGTAFLFCNMYCTRTLLSYNFNIETEFIIP